MISLHQVSFSFHKLQKRNDFLITSHRLIKSLWLLFLISLQMTQILCAPFSSYLKPAVKDEMRRRLLVVADTEW